MSTKDKAKGSGKSGTRLKELEAPESKMAMPTFNGGFKNNKLLKKVGSPFEWTEKGIIEYKKCADDPIYFIRTYMKIINVDKGLMHFELRDYQKHMIHAIKDNRAIIMCMARQSGKSTAVVGFILWYILFNPHVTAVLLANKEKTALEILNKAHVAYMYLPLFLQQGIVEWNKSNIVLENGSRVIADSTASDAVRGYAVNLLVLDEAAHIENWEDFSTSVLPTISSGETTKIVQISTPKGLNHFYKTWTNAQPDAKFPNNYYPISVHWTDVPGRDNKWKDEQLKILNNDLDKFAQEYECEFMGSSGTLIAGWKLKQMMKNFEEPISKSNNLYKYRAPLPQHFYAITVDCSEGKGFDYSVVNVFDITRMPYQQVAIFRSNESSPAETAQIIFETAKSYNNAAVLVEFASLGPQVSHILHTDHGYENMLSTCTHGSRGKVITLTGGKNVDMGINMSSVVRRTGCSLIKLLIEQNQLLIPDYETINEFATFSREEGYGKFEAEEGCKDDIVMTCVVFAWLTDQEYFTDMTNIDTISKLREKTENEIEDELMPLGFVDRGVPEIIEYDKPYVSWIVEMDPNDPDYPKNF